MGIISYFKKEAHIFYKEMEINNHELMYVYLQITANCNYSCKLCTTNCSQTSSPALTKQEWLNFIQYLKSKYNKGISVVLTGGEPMLSPHFEEITRRLGSLKMRWSLNTNGYFMDEDKMESLQEAKIGNISISLHGNKEAHNSIMGDCNAYDSTIKALKLINRSGIKHREVKTIVTPLIINSLNEVAQLMIAQRVVIWKLIPATRQMVKADSSLLLTFEQGQSLIRWIVARKKHYEKLGLDVMLGESGWLPYKLDKKVREHLFICRAGINKAAILNDGTINGAIEAHKQYGQGNITNDDFKKIWDTKFEVYRNRKWLEKTYCQECKYFFDCRGSSFEYWKTNAEKPYFCFVHPL